MVKDKVKNTEDTSKSSKHHVSFIETAQKHYLERRQEIKDKRFKLFLLIIGILIFCFVTASLWFSNFS